MFKVDCGSGHLTATPSALAVEHRAEGSSEFSRTSKSIPSTYHALQGRRGRTALYSSSGMTHHSVRLREFEAELLPSMSQNAGSAGELACKISLLPWLNLGIVRMVTGACRLVYCMPM